MVSIVASDDSNNSPVAKVLLPTATGGQVEALAVVSVDAAGNVVGSDPAGSVFQIYASPENRFAYAAPTGGITASTAGVQIAAASAGVRNYLASAQVDWDSLVAPTEFVVRDGSNSTVLWRMKIAAGAAGQREIAFPVPLRGSVNTLMEVATATSNAGGVYFNGQGFRGA